MELQFQKKLCRCLKPAVYEVQNQEQTQELKLGDAMPDIGRILGAWGQVILRGKEWRGDSVGFSGGLMVWVLYAPEDGSSPRTLDTWIPFQMKWELPDGTKEGDLRMEGRLRFLDARSVSPRKIMLRAGIAALAEALEPQETEVSIPGELPEDVAVLKNTYPVRLPRESGEKSFQLDEDLILPESAPVPEKLVYYTLQPQVTDKKFLGGKAVFKGTACLHILYLSEEGQLHSWDFALPFSQFGELEGELSGDAQTDVTMAVTDLDLALDAEGHMRLKCGLVAQYLADDRMLLELAEDAYSPRRVAEPQNALLELPALLDSRSENLYGEQNIQADADTVVDAVFLPDYPRQRRMDSGIQLELPGQFQILYYTADGSIQSGQARWEGSHSIPAHENSRVYAGIQPVGSPQVTTGDGTVSLKNELRLSQKAYSAQGIPMISGLKLGDLREPDPARPSVILRRAGRKGLWDLAKESGSTVEAIRSANRLQEEPEENRMLLIPVI